MIQLNVMKNAGFSLVELMITSAIVGVIVLAISQLMVNFANQQKQVDVRSTYSQVVQSVGATAGQTSTLISSEALFD